MPPREIKISAVLCTYNEDHWLREALSSLSWVDELIVCDMGSTDQTVAIAQSHKATIQKIPRVPYVELVREKAVSFCKHPWVLFFDPDFIFPKEYAGELQSILENNKEITVVNMLYCNYFAGKVVKAGKWAVRNRYPLLFKKEAMALPPVLHNGFQKKYGISYEPPQNFFLKHMWVNSEEHFYRKHLRYLLHEGERRIAKGEKPSLLKLFVGHTKQLRRFITSGFPGGFWGFSLLKKSFWYETEAQWQLRLDNQTARAWDSTKKAENATRVVRVFYNYYRDSNAPRAAEVDYCLQRIAETSWVHEVVVFTEDSLPITSEKIQLASNKAWNRPSFREIFGEIRKISKDSDVNIVINSDCFIDPRDSSLIMALSNDQALCLGRYEIIKSFLSGQFLGIPRIKSRFWRDMQDCWIFRGKPKSNMWLDFHPGTPGCDNRLAYEFKNAGYKITNPMDSIRVYHYHLSKARKYTEENRVPEPYAIPERDV